MERYDKYKPSGVEWIGEIPEHWEVERTKWLFAESKLRNRESESFDEDLLSVSEYYGIAKRIERIDNNDILNRAESLSEYKIVTQGELVINIMLAWKKGLGISNCNGIVSPSYCVFKLLDEKNDPKFFHYLYRTDLYAEVFRQNSRGIIDSRLRLYPEEFFNIITIVPPIPEQTAIANFLDDKTAKIDSLVEKKKKLIELLKEERTAVINQAVTRGINPNAKLKPSGINWLGDIPEHWQVKKMKYVMNSFDHVRIPISADLRGGEKIYDYYGASGVIDKVPDYLFDGDHILIGEDGANLLTRSTALAFKATGKFWVNNHAHILKPKFGNVDFYTYLLESIDYTIWVTGSAQPKLTAENLLNIKIWFPDREEQNQIVQYIETETKRIDETISKIEKEIGLLQEYRTALINEMVTGKIKV